MHTVILLTFLIKTATGVEVEDLAIVKDMPTCKIIAASLNEKLKDDPNAQVICREAHPPEKV